MAKQLFFDREKDKQLSKYFKLEVFNIWDNETVKLRINKEFKIKRIEESKILKL